MKARIVLFVTLGCTVALSSLAAATQTLLMNRLGPSQMVLYIANADDAGERPLFGTSGFDYNASFSSDGQWSRTWTMWTRTSFASPLDSRQTRAWTR